MEKKFELIDKKIVKSYELLKKYIKNNKFKDKKINNFIYVYLLYIQNNYNLDFKFKNTKNDKSLYDCLKFLYKSYNHKKVKNTLFPKDKLLSDIYIHDEKFNPKKIIQLLSDKIYANNYVNINIEIIDYLGNSNNDLELINLAICFLFFKKLHPEIEIDNKLINHLVSNLIVMGNRINNNNDLGKPIIKYTNTHAILLLFMLKKIHKFPKLDSWIDNLLDNGKWNNGYNSYFTTNPDLLDLVHTAISMIVLLEYRTLQYHLIRQNIKENIQEETVEEEEEEEDTVEEKEETVDKEILVEEDKLNKQILETFTNVEKDVEQYKQTIEYFDDLNSKNKGYYTLNFNFYNVSIIILVICLIYILLKFKTKK